MYVIVICGHDDAGHFTYVQRELDDFCVINDIPNLLAWFPSTELSDASFNSDRSWFYASSAVMDATLRISEWLQQCYKADGDHIFNSLARRFQKEVVYRRDPEAFYVLHRLQLDQIAKMKLADFEESGDQIVIKPSPLMNNRESLALQWCSNDTHYFLRDALILQEGCLPFSIDDLRTVHFVRQGIDIRDQHGTSLAVTRMRPVTVPISFVLITLPDPVREGLLALWENETGLSRREGVLVNASIWKVSKATSEEAIPATHFEGRKANFNFVGDSKQKTKSSLESLMPLQRGDMAWLFDRFLNEAYPAAQSRVNVSNDPEDIVTDLASIWDKLQM